ncbi:Nucleotide-diphospho-sugar transferases superfamily protein [Perilla frutescens var. hirtella]|uniref:Glycosyltransferases n=1 Tax=Perilla frutescens var. hirtella TaxID=608512 RepID=A0AAD4P212_PERFH|nr:Nucleotide-diphospho-sugar transferases superfamily protein [Perilla frutescens var. hirtella]
MKQLTALQQQGRRSNSFRSASSPLDATVDGAIKSPATVFWLLLHGLCCLISLVLGFRFSRLVFFLLFSASPSPSTTTIYSALRTTLPTSTAPERNASAGGGGSRVVVGRHGILIRPWPHPDPAEVMKAHRIIERVQAEQRSQYGVKNPKTVIAVTPTYVRTFQTLHLTGVMHSLMNVRYDLVWIVVEAGGTTNETASLIAKSGLKTIHIGFNGKMPILWEDRHKLESRMRLLALRIVREKKLDGIVMFADDSNMHNLELFDEIQNVKWVGAVSVGILAHSGGSEEGGLLMGESDADEKDEKRSQIPVQGPACNASNNLVGWHTFDTQPFIERSARYIGDRAVVLPRKLEWAGFVLNSRLVWEDMEEKPDWVKELDEIGKDGEEVESPLSLLKDISVVEPLGSCGRKVLLWWLRVEARADSKFPARWIIDPPLDITIPAKHTPWPDAPPELPTSTEKVITIPENNEKRPTKSGSRRKRSSRSKRKHSPKVLDEHVSTKNAGDN